MSRLLISRDLLQQIEDHATSQYPEECCGVMVGEAATNGGPTRVRELVAVDNEREDSARHNRYLISPLAILETQKSARADGMDIVGYYHSHPDHPAAPSEFDRDHAWPSTSYLIVSVEAGTVADVRSWRLTDDRQRFETEAVERLATSRVTAK